MIGALEGPMQIFRVPIAGKPARQARTPRDPVTPRTPREGTKHQQLLTMLRRSEDATIAQLVEATGRQQHTAHGFCGGLEKRPGIVVKVMGRVRQGGPDKRAQRKHPALRGRAPPGLDRGAREARRWPRGTCLPLSAKRLLSARRAAVGYLRAAPIDPAQRRATLFA